MQLMIGMWLLSAYDNIVPHVGSDQYEPMHTAKNLERINPFPMIMRIIRACRECIYAFRFPSSKMRNGENRSYETSSYIMQKTAPFWMRFRMLALPIFPASHPASIVGADELNFCVRDGNRWTLIAINTNSYGWVSPSFMSKPLFRF